ncbi:addiction module protein [Zavarzinella formosa]|uniref:addiction module protein n=1 Tax=Zavarzinella formosa TaxID=360055 RepID=UPI0002F56A5E|nr:addiction module protein [Zavarzinella formosa]
MTSEVERLLREVTALEKSDQLLFHRLLEDTLALGDEIEEDPELLAELDRREAEFLNGESPAIPADEVFAKLRAKFK